MECSQCKTRCNEIGICFNPACSRNTSYKLNTYIKQLENSKESLEECIGLILSLLKPLKGTIFLTGIGKSAHIVRKNVATWQSLGISAHTLLVQDMFHGDMGILKNGDVILYITNSGNTDELLTVSKYIKENFSVMQICISNNPSAKLASFVDYSFNICNFKIKEADTLNIAPTVSCVIFMTLLDIIGIHLAELNEITREDFQRNHPGGDIGKIK